MYPPSCNSLPGRNLPYSQQRTTAAHPWYVAVLGALAALLISQCLVGAASGGHPAALSEQGWVERSTALVFLILAIATSPWFSVRHFKRVGFIPVVLTLFTLRELDFDKRFTGAGVLQQKLYVGDYPLSHQLIGLAVIALVLITAAAAVMRGLELWRQRHQGLQSWHAYTLISIAWIAVAKSLDGAGRKLQPLGIDLPSQLNSSLSAWEEVLELSAALLLAVAFLQFQRAKAKRQRIDQFRQH